MLEEVNHLSRVALTQWSFFGIVLFSGMIASWLSIRSTRGPRERRFALASNLMAWTLLLAMLGLLFALPSPWNFIVFIPYLIHVPFAVYFTVKRQLMVRIIDGREQDDGTGEP